MKKLMSVLISTTAIIMLTSCTGLVEKAKEKAKQAIEKAAAEAAEAKTETEAADESEKTESATIKTETKQESEWWQNNFSISYEFLAMANMTTYGTIYRKGDAVRMIMKIGGTSSDILYRTEGEVVVKYILNLEKKNAIRSIATHTADRYLKERLSDHTVIPTKDLSIQKDSKKVDTEKIVGRTATKWVQEKTILTSFTRATMWLDDEYGFALRTEVYAAIDGKEVMNTTSLVVTAASFNPDPKEIEIDLSSFNIVEQ